MIMIEIAIIIILTIMVMTVIMIFKKMIKVKGMDKKPSVMAGKARRCGVARSGFPTQRATFAGCNTPSQMFGGLPGESVIWETHWR